MKSFEFDDMEILDENGSPNLLPSSDIRNKNDISESKGGIKKDNFEGFLQHLQSMAKSEKPSSNHLAISYQVHPDKCRSNSKNNSTDKSKKYFNFKLDVKRSRGNST